MVAKKVMLNNREGLHVRPAGLFSNEMQKFLSDVWVCHKEAAVSGKSIMNLIAAGIQCGDEVEIRCSGPDEEEALSRAVELIEFRPGRSGRWPCMTGERVLYGVAASPGIGIGHALVYKEKPMGSLEREIADPKLELERYHSAVETFCHVTQVKADRVAEMAGKERGDIIRCQADMIRDPYLNGQVEGRIASGQSAEAALSASCDLFIDLFTAAEDEVTRQRAADVRDLRGGMLRLLLGLPEMDFSALQPGTVLLAEELSPSAVSVLNSANVAGIVLGKGGPTSHSAILARALEIPAVLGLEDRVLDAATGETLIVDGNRGCVVFSPGQVMKSVYEGRQKDFQQLRASLRVFVGRETVTADGKRIQLGANAGSVGDATRAAGYGCDGIGLLRTEFLYLDRTSQPGEEEQFHAYRQILAAMRGKRVIIRTLDVGGDKTLPYLHQPHEENPFLGCRGLRFSLREEDMFRSHLRAVLRASAYGKAHLLLPMVTGVEEVRRAREILEEEKEALRRRKVAFDENLPMGVMVETVSACLMADAFSKEADFFSLGTNDLTQYVLGVDRGNARVAHLYSYFHPAVLRLVRQVLETARRTGTKVSMCGEAAADTALTPVLLTFGLEAFSVAPVSLLPVRKAISLWTMEEAKAVTEKAMSLETEEEVQAFLKEHEKK